MVDERREPEETADRAGEARNASVARKGFARRHWLMVTLLALVLVPTLGFTIWAGLALSYTYSSGERVGYVQKLSKKGWLCKSWEGELQMSNVPGSAPMLFHFTVRDDSLAKLIQGSEGGQVSLQFDQHVGLPSSCFGDTEYFITALRPVGPTK